MIPRRCGTTDPVGAQPNEPPRRLVPPRWRPAALVTASLCAAATLVLALRYRGDDEAGRVDALFDNAVDARGSRWRWTLERLIDLGDPIPAAVLAVLVGLGCLATRRWSGVLLAVLGPATAVTIAQFVLKPLVGRTDEDGLVFPSGHATAFGAIGAVVTVLLLDARWPRSSAVRLWLIAGVLLVVGAKAAALAAVGYHYLTDGLGGAGLAISVVLAVAVALDAAQKLVRNSVQVRSLT